MPKVMRSVVISPSRDLSLQLTRVLAEFSAVSVVRVLEGYPNEVELTRTLRAHAPHLVFLSIESMKECSALAAHLEQIMPGIQVIAIGEGCQAEGLMTIMRAGIREFLASPFETTCVQDCLVRAMENLDRRPVSYQSTELLYSFLPSKPGVGTTTLALNGAMAAARHEGTSTLLADFDLNCGMTRFMMKLENPYSVMDAAQNASRLDENLWGQLVSKTGQLDVLHAGMMNPDLRIETLQIQHLFDFVRRNYKLICADLSGNLEKYSLEIMHESKRIFLVCTPEVSSLHLAREKFQYLQRMDLGGRVSLLLNRYHKRSAVSPSDVEQLVGVPVAATFANDYNRVAQAISDAKPIDGGSELGRQCGAFADMLLEKKQASAPQPKKRLVEYFAITPARFTLDSSK